MELQKVGPADATSDATIRRWNSDGRSTSTDSGVGGEVALMSDCRATYTVTTHSGWSAAMSRLTQLPRMPSRRGVAMASTLLIGPSASAVPLQGGADKA